MAPKKRRPNASPARKRPAVSEPPHDIESPKPEKISNASVSTQKQTDWQQDIRPMCLLLLLYTLQGVPMGLASAVPFLMQNKVRNIDSVPSPV